MSEVGALIVKLTAETAQFREDMGKVKRDLDDLGEGGHRAGRGVGEGMGEAKGGLMLFEDAVGVRLPRHLNSLIAEIPGVGAAFATMLPLAGVLVAIKIIGELIAKHQEMKEKLLEAAHAQVEFGNTSAEVLSHLEGKLLQSGIKVDELKKNHLAALKKQLELIDDQSLDNLTETFAKFAQGADKVFADLKTSWYEFGIGSAGAKNALTEFQLQYGKLKNDGNTAGMSSLLAGTLKDAKEVQSALETISKPRPATTGNEITDLKNLGTYQAALNRLKEAGAEPYIKTQEAIHKELDSQNALVLALTEQGKAAETIAKIKSTDITGTKLAEAKRAHEDSNKAMEQELSLQHIILQGTDAAIAAARKLAQTKAEGVAASVKTPEQSAEADTGQKLDEIETVHKAAVQAANDELDSKKRAYDAEIKAAAGNAAKLKELNAQLANDQRATRDAIAQADAEAATKSIVVTTDAKNEQAREAIAAAQQQYDGELKAAIAGAQNQQKLAIETAKNLQALGKLTSAQTLQAETTANSILAAAEKAAYDKRISLLDKFSKDYAKQVAKLNAEVLADTTKGDQQVTQEKTAATQKQMQTVVSAENRMKDAIATDIAHSIVMNKSLAQAFRQTGEEMAEGMIKDLIMMELTADKTKLINAKKAYGDSYTWASAWGGPIAGSIAGAAAFASVMSFEVGGKIPGEGPVPITGHGGETVVTKALTDRVESSERNRGSGGSGGGDMHMHYAPQIHAVDANGVDAMLTKHGAVIQRHITATMRRMNKG